MDPEIEALVLEAIARAQEKSAVMNDGVVSNMEASMIFIQAQLSMLTNLLIEDDADKKSFWRAVATVIQEGKVNGAA